MNLGILLAYCLALFVAAAIPGPGMTAIAARALGSSFRSTLPMGLGMATGDLIYLSAVISGLAVVAQQFGTIFMIIKYAGALYLAWLAYKLWTAGIAVADIQSAKPRNFIVSFLSGLFITLGNPKTMLFYLALVPSILDLSSISAMDFVILCATTLVVLLSVIVPYTLAATRVRLLMKQPKRLRIVNRVAAGFMGGSALLIAARAN